MVSVQTPNEKPKDEAPGKSFDEVLKRMLDKPPAPKVKPVKEKAAK